MIKALDHKEFLTTFCIPMSFPNHWHAKPLFMEEGFIQIGKHSTLGRWPCILLSVDFTYKINVFIGTKYVSGERMIILHAGYNERFLPNARKKSFYNI